MGNIAFLLMVGPMNKCFCCKSLSAKNPVNTSNRWNVYTAIAVVIGLAMLVWSVVATEFLTGAMFQIVISFYFVLCQAESFQRNRQNLTLRKAMPEFCYLFAALIMVAWGALYWETATDCFRAFYATEDNDYFCPFQFNFNHNAVLHILQLVFLISLFCGVWMETSRDQKPRVNFDEDPEDEEAQMVEPSNQAEMANLVADSNASATDSANDAI